MNIKNKPISLLLFLIALSSCSHKQVSIYRPGDQELTCAQILSEIGETEKTLSDIHGKRGFSGRNVAMGIIFWPGIVVNEMNGSSAATTAQKRLEVLNKLYIDKRCRISSSK